jgi:hypothetical protein
VAPYKFLKFEKGEGSKTDMIPQFWGSPGHKLNFNPNFKMFTKCWMDAECKTYIVFCLILQHSAQAMQFHENFNLANLHETQSFNHIQKLELKLEKSEPILHADTI